MNEGNGACVYKKTFVFSYGREFSMSFALQRDSSSACREFAYVRDDPLFDLPQISTRNAIRCWVETILSLQAVTATFGAEIHNSGINIRLEGFLTDI
ncbi:hypothetical protein CEXT_42801 [Caerostris extrusa]|uniref:Uncharacterized protein n=1 Tax=Caerostris extrusa TaxID=172846 RepID=A0AAV4TTQ8_CAEEX|nr:hypothetical protein CEXT_42801 [Caerostris extrusa]